MSIVIISALLGVQSTPTAGPAPKLDTMSACLISVGLFFTIIFLRYVFMSGMYHYLVYRWFGGRHPYRVIHEPPDAAQLTKEIRWSAITSLIFSVSTVAMLWMWEKGYTAVYLDIDDYPLWYLPVSLFVIMAIHETYYYWLHRWMHRPGIYRLIHKVHHDSIETSSWTSFSFHPLESILQAIVIPIVIFFIPVNVFVLLLLLIFMTISAIINHAAVEVYPRHFDTHPLGRWIIGSAHHDLHHKQFRYNFGLYFTIWDKWMNTESPDFTALFEAKTTGPDARVDSD